MNGRGVGLTCPASTWADQMDEARMVKVFCRRSHALSVARLIIAACADEHASVIRLQVADGVVEFNIPVEEGVLRTVGGD